MTIILSLATSQLQAISFPFSAFKKASKQTATKTNISQKFIAGARNLPTNIKNGLNKKNAIVFTKCLAKGLALTALISVASLMSFRTKQILSIGDDKSGSYIEEISIPKSNLMKIFILKAIYSGFSTTGLRFDFIFESYVGVSLINELMKCSYYYYKKTEKTIAFTKFIKNHIKIFSAFGLRKPTSLFNFCCDEKLEILKCIVENFPIVTKKTFEGNNLLHVACFIGNNPKTIEYLINLGCFDINKKSLNTDKTPIEFAIENNCSQEVEDLLIANGATKTLNRKPKNNTITPSVQDLLYKVLQNNQNFYDLLNIEKCSDETVIKKAVKQKRCKFHPDKYPEDKKLELEEMTHSIVNAEIILLNTDARKVYDNNLRSSTKEKTFTATKLAVENEDMPELI